jgi:predicted RND superfamily exporter protein
VWIDQLKESVTANRVVASDLPPSIRDRFIASDGRARVEVYPSADLSDPAALEDFVDGVRRVVPASAGSAVEIVESGRAIVVALRQALVGAVLAVTVLLLVLWGSVKDTLIVLSALLLGATFTAATMVAIGLNLNFADVIVLPLLLGIGVDSGIHFMHRYRMGESAGLVLGSSTARAVLFSALTTIASFGSLAFSSHKGIASLGILLSVGLSYMLTANLVFLPALLVLFERRRGRHIAPNVRRRRLA